MQGCDKTKFVCERKIQEAIYIGNNIKIEIFDIIGKRVKLVINAPKDVPIYREEVITKARSFCDNSRNE